MKKILGGEAYMFTNIENLKIEDIHKGKSKARSTVTCRKRSSFVLRTAGCSRYTFSDRIIDVHPGEIIFLPQGSSYDTAVISDIPSEYVALRFSADLDKATPSVYSIESFQDADEFANSLTELWKFGNKAEHYKCYSVFYNLLAYIENIENLSYIDKKKINIISPAISYLKTHIYDCSLKTEMLHQLCGISVTYFRKIFESNYGISPQKYILGKRLSHAKTIIDSGDFDTISEISATVGYNDPLYFSRAFKKAYGLSPSQYAKKI